MSNKHTHEVVSRKFLSVNLLIFALSASVACQDNGSMESDVADQNISCCILVRNIHSPDGQNETARRTFDKSLLKSLAAVSRWQVVEESQVNRTLLKDEALAHMIEELGIRVDVRPMLNVEGDVAQFLIVVREFPSGALIRKEDYRGTKEDAIVVAGDLAEFLNELTLH